MRLILLIATLILSACGAKPQPPRVDRECALVAVEGLAPYLYCKDPNDQSKEGWRLELPRPNPEEKYVCTTVDSYVAAKIYAKELNDWVNQNCVNKAN